MNNVIPDPHEQILPVAENLLKVVLFIVLLFGSFYFCDRVTNVIETTTSLSPNVAFFAKWVVVALLAVINGMLLIGMGVLAHDAVHRVLFRSPFWNEFWGGVLSAFILVPFYANRQFHLTHHSYAHQPGLDPENVAHHYPFYFALAVGSFIGLAEQYRIFFTNVLKIGERRYRLRTLKDAVFLSIVAAVYFWAVPAAGLALSETVIPLILAFPVVFSVRALSDHYGIPPVVREVKKREDITDVDEQAWHDGREQRRQEVSGWVVQTARWLQWFWSHVNYHEVHHRYPYLSHRYLPQVFAATCERYPYLVVRGYWRSLFHLRKRPYYASSEDVRPYLSSTSTGS